MLDRIRAIALEKLGSEEAADAFMAGFEKAAMEKSASVASVMGSTMWNHPLAKPAMGIGASLLGAAIVKGISSGSKAMEVSHLRGQFDMALSQVMSTNKIVKGARPEKVKDFAETMFRFAPHVASDPNLLGTLLANAIQGETIDVQTIKTLVDLEGRYADNNRTGPVATFKA